MNWNWSRLVERAKDAKELIGLALVIGGLLSAVGGHLYELWRAPDRIEAQSATLSEVQHRFRDFVQSWNLYRCEQEGIPPTECPVNDIPEPPDNDP